MLKVKAAVGNEISETPLHEAASGDAPETVAALLEAGADINSKGRYGETPLHCAAHNNSVPEIIIVLLEKNADPDCRDKNGKTPMDLAIKRNVSYIIKALQTGI